MNVAFFGQNLILLQFADAEAWGPIKDRLTIFSYK